VGSAEEAMTMSWRVFYHPGTTASDSMQGVMTALESEIAQSEAEAKDLVRQFLEQGRPGISVHQPGKARVLKGRELRAWLED
jgi:hypothetical protein